MKFVFGIIFAAACIFGGFVLSHGNLETLFQPFEFMIIAGGASGAFVIANTGKVIKEVLIGIPGLLKGSSYNKSMYMDLLSLMYKLFVKARKEGLMALEGDVDEPEDSEIFQAFPRILNNHHVINFITDYLRLMVGGNMNAFELESLMDLELQTHHQESHEPSAALQTTADALPGFGIVAAVMGVVITMSFITDPPEVLGAHIAAALVGTFLGVLLCYGFVGPMANALGIKASEEGKFLECAKVCIMSTLNGYTPQIAVEFGRKVIYSHMRPTFFELEEHIKGR